MTASVKPANSPLLAERLENLRFQVVASDAARALARVVGANVKAARLEKGLNGRELADEIKKLDPERAPVPQRVSDWERGVQKPDDRYLRSLSQILEKPIAWFYADHQAEVEGDGAPDLIADLNGSAASEQLDRIEAELIRLRQAVAALVAGELERANRLTGPPPRRRGHGGNRPPEAS